MDDFQHSHRLVNQGKVDDMMIFNAELARGLFQKVGNFATRPDDLFLASYPKTGTTWLQHIVWYVTHPTNIEQTDPSSIEHHFPYLELPYKLPNGKYSLEVCEELASPRFIKSHLPARYFEKAISAKDAPKFIVCLRNPKSTLVSMYNFYRMNKMLGSFSQGWDEFFKLYEVGEIMYGDLLDHFAGWWKLKDRENVMILKYEDMKKDPEQAIKDIAAYLGERLTDDQVKTIAEKTSFKEMSTNVVMKAEKAKTFDSNVSRFFRKGEIGDWKNYFNEVQSRRVDEDVAKKLTPLGLYFTYE